ncbi:hypothetical protein BKI52_24365 [marine bacterium AO1-C]|nr:hypothetical protein BKI52_24365 [marine bacterium AO1-C]
MTPPSRKTYIASDRKPEITVPKLLGIVLALIIIWGVVFIMLSLFPTWREFFVDISIAMSGLIVAALLGEHFLKTRESDRLQLIYKLRIDDGKQKIQLEKLKARGFVQFARTTAVLLHEGVFVTLELRSAKTQKVIGTLTTKNDRWEKKELLQVARELHEVGVAVQEKNLPVGEVVGNKVTFEHSLLNSYIVALFVLLLTFLIAAAVTGVLQESPFGFLLTMGVLYGLMVYPQKKFIITPTHLIVKNRWLPLYRHQLSIDNIKAIQAITAYARRDVQEYLQVDLIKKRKNKSHQTLKFYSILGREHIRQVVYLVKNHMQELPKRPTLGETRVDGSRDITPTTPANG